MGQQDMRVTYSTDQVSNRESFAFWKDAICDAYVHLGCENLSRDGFHGAIDLSALNETRLSFVSSDAQHVRRRRRDIGRSTDDDFLLSIQLRGNGLIRQAGREAYLAPGDFALYSSTDPYELLFPAGFEQLVVQVPKKSLLEEIPISDQLTAIPVSGQQSSGLTVTRTIVEIARGLGGDQDGMAAGKLEAAIREMICCGLYQIRGADCQPVNRSELLTTLRIESYIASHLDRPDLNRQQVASGVGLSVRRVNELLARQDSSITRKIRDSRLDHIRRELGSPSLRHEQIGTIAAKWGFCDLQHFSRSFRRAYGCSPREYRKQHADGLSGMKP